MRTKNILKEIIDELDQFEQTLQDDKEVGMKDFLAYLSTNKNQSPRYSADIEIVQQISLLHRYSKFYVKRILKDSPMQTMDEYTYLIPLLESESMTKTELNNMNAMEKTSGNEVINRLLKKNLIVQKRDELDRRSMRVYITDLGKRELFKIIPDLQKIAIFFSSNLSQFQKLSLASNLNSMSHLHKDIFLNDKDKQLDDMEEK